MSPGKILAAASAPLARSRDKTRLEDVKRRRTANVKGGAGRASGMPGTIAQVAPVLTSCLTISRRAREFQGKTLKR